MDKYTMIKNIENNIQKIENYRDNSFIYAHMVGLMSVYLTNEQVADMNRALEKELEMKEISDELKYEMKVSN